MAETVRELAVKLQLAVDKGSFGEGEKAIARVKGQAQGLGDSFGSLKGALVGLGIVAGMAKAKEAFIDFNSTVEQSTISLAAMQRMYKQDGSWAESMRTATGLFGYYQEVAKASVGETKDFIEMHKAIAASAYQAGGNLEDLKEITKGAVIASSSMGESAWTSSMDIKQALTKGVEIRDRFMNNLLASEKISKEKFNAMNKRDRLLTLKKLFQSDWIKDASKQMEGSFAGLTSTLKDELSIALGKVGQNFFQGQIASLKKITEWITKNQDEWKKFQGLAESGLTFLTTLGKGLMGVLALAVKPAMALLEGLQEIQDYGKYKAGELSVRGMREAFAQGPEAYDRYMAIHYYKTAKKPGQGPGAGAGTAKLGKYARERDKGGVGGFLDRLGRWGAGSAPSLLTPERQRREDAWYEDYKRRYGRAPTAEDLDAYRADEDAMWKSGKITATGQGGYSAGPVMSMPGPNYSSGYGPSTYAPIPVAPEARVSGDVNIKVKVDLGPEIESKVEQVLETRFREGNELMSVEP